MTQAICNIIPHSKQTVSRRAALTGAAVIAVALPVTVKAAPNPDAELLELGRRFDELLLVYADAKKRSKPNDDAWQRQMEKFSERHNGPIAVSISNEEYEEAGARIDRDYPIAYPDCGDVFDLMDDPQRRIMTLPAFALAGLVVKAKVAKFGSDHIYQTNFEDADWDHKTMRSLIDAVLQLGAVQS
jgi:hypothetical protein